MAARQRAAKLSRHSMIYVSDLVNSDAIPTLNK